MAKKKPTRHHVRASNTMGCTDEKAMKNLTITIKVKNRNIEVCSNGRTTDDMTFGEMIEQLIGMASPDTPYFEKYQMLTPDEWECKWETIRTIERIAKLGGENEA